MRFSSFALLDKGDRYKTLCQQIVRRRLQALCEGLGFELPADSLRAELVDFGLSRGADLDGASRGEPAGTVPLRAPSWWRRLFS